jgi:UDP-glucose 4-epimerase
MHVLVTGGAGFIGSHTVDLLLAQGHTVCVLDDFSSGSEDNLAAAIASAGARLRVVRGDICDAAAVQEAIAGCTHVVHLAAQVFVPVSIAAPARSSAVNVGGFLNVLDAARRAGVQRFVYASSAAVYGAPEALPVTEATPPQALSPYALDKLVNDQYAGLFSALYGMSCCGLRYFNVYGPRQDPRSTYSGVISKFTERASAGEALVVFGDGEQTRDFIAVADVARANLAALAADCLGVVNVATGVSVSLRALIEAIGALAGRRLEVQYAPPRAGEVRHSAVDPRRLREALGVTGCSPLGVGLAPVLGAGGRPAAG